VLVLDVGEKWGVYRLQVGVELPAKKSEHEGRTVSGIILILKESRPATRLEG